MWEDYTDEGREKLGRDMYSWTHGLHRGSCYKRHKDWRKELREEYKNLKKRGGL